MAISSVSSVTTIPPQATTPAQADATNAAAVKSPTASSPAADQTSSAASAPAGAAPTVLTQGSGSVNHHHKKHHALPGHPGHQINKSA